jgi:Flp pilus assembly protein TadG
MPRSILRETRKGAIAVLAAVCLIIAVAFLAFAVDWGYIAVTSGELQNAADAAALAGARALPKGRSDAIAAAQQWAARNVAAGDSVLVNAEDDVQVGVWDSETSSFTALPSNSPTSPNAVRVICRRTSARGNPLSLFFGGVLGTDSVDVTSSATARVTMGRCGLIIGLIKVKMSGSSHTNSYNSSDGLFIPSNATNRGHVCSNRTIEMSGSSAIYGDAHHGPGYEVKSSSSIGVVCNINVLPNPLSFPPVDSGHVASNNHNGAIPLSAQGKNPLNSKLEFGLSGGDSVSLPAGKYYFTKLSLSGGSIIYVSGPTEIYVNGDVAISGGSVANLTQLPRNLQLYVEGKNCSLSGSSQFFGVVYAPATKVVRSGESHFFGAIISRELELSGGGGIYADESLDLNPLGNAQRAILVE